MLLQERMTSQPSSHRQDSTSSGTETRLLERALLEASEREKKKIGQNLHDNLCQQLVGAAFAAKAIGDELTRKNSPGAAQMQQLAGLINDAVKQTREVVRGLRPVDMDASGLMSALDDLLYQSDPKVSPKFICPGNVLMRDPDSALQAYRIVQDSLAHILHHTGVKSLTLELSEKDGMIRMSICATGIDKAAFLQEIKPIDLKVMHYRANAIGGQFDIEPNNPDELCIICAFPESP